MKAYQRLINYTAYEAASDENSPAQPSTPSQLEFGKALVEEMKALGISDAEIDEHGYVYGSIPANVENAPVIGFIAHMDVVDDVNYKNIKASVVENYDGGDIVLNKEKNIVMSPNEYESLKKYVGNDLVVSDGTTLIGADDRAGVAEIMTAAEIILGDPTIRHGKIAIGFTPDEEIGRGALKFDVKKFGADFAYTLDGAAFGEVTYETFNAAAAKIKVVGKNIHPGSAKNKMKNAQLIAMEFASMLPQAEKPEYTEKYEGFYHLTEMKGTVEEAEMSWILRDHDSEKLEIKKRTVENAAEFLNKKYGQGTVTADISDTYRNMAEKVLEHPEVLEKAFKAVEKAGGTPFSSPMRGGTDGATLSFMGLPCPNLGTGSHNHHGTFEYASVQAMDKCVEVILNILTVE